MKLLTAKLPETAFEKLRKLKERHGYGDRDWSEWLIFLSKSVRLKDTMGEAIHKSTVDQLLELWTANFAENLPKIRRDKSIADLLPEEPDKVPKGSAIVIGAGPSVIKNRHLELLRDSGYKGVIISTDGMLIKCLKAGVVPTCVLSVDGNRERIVKWYDDPVVDEYGSEIKGLFASTVAPNVYRRARKAGIEVYWFLPMYDDWRQNESFTRLQTLMTKCKNLPRGLPAAQVGGNAGTACWIQMWALFKRSPVALIGIDFGYLDGTPIEETSYYQSLMAGTGGNPEEARKYLTTIYNPYFKLKAMTDPVFLTYRNSFLDMLKEVDAWVETWNCTEGGILFTEDHNLKLYCKPFKEFLEKYRE